MYESLAYSGFHSSKGLGKFRGNLHVRQTFEERQSNRLAGGFVDAQQDMFVQFDTRRIFAGRERNRQGIARLIVMEGRIDHGLTRLPFI